jgi:Putative DNA-binding domain
MSSLLHAFPENSVNLSLLNNTYDSKKEFLADVSSFANAAGGHLVIGMKEQAGLPVELCGLSNINADAEITRLENLIRDGIKQRIYGVACQVVPLRNSSVAVVIRVPRSWAAPHVVDFQGHWRFYSRTSNGKYPLDIGEVRAAFAFSQTTAERLRNFRAERLGRIVAGETPVLLEGRARTVLHIIPMGAFDPAVSFHVAGLANQQGSRYLAPINPSGWNLRHNFDGFLTYTGTNEPKTARSYAQIFRHGSIEAVEAYLLREDDGARTIPIDPFEDTLLEALPRYLALQKHLGVEPPLFIMLSLLGVVGYRVDTGARRLPALSIDRDALVIPEVMIESFECNPADVMKPLFDVIWNAGGFPGCMNYDETGNRIQRRR